MRLLSALLAAGLLLGMALPAAAQQSSGPTNLSSLVSKVSPGVVTLYVIKRDRPEDPAEPERVVVSTGSGFVIDSRGYLVSNAHVLEGAISARAIAHDGRIYPIRPSQIWADTASDLAVARVEAQLPPLAWGDSDKLKPGDPVVAMGAPFGLRFRTSVSNGIISGLDRRLSADFAFLQHDAPINPGNSGGPLLNLAGEVVGVNARGVLGGDGMGFAIPSGLASLIVDQLIAEGAVSRAWLGLRFADGSDADLGWSVDTGPVVSLLEENGPARGSGVQVGDTLLSIEGQRVKSLEEIAEVLIRQLPGTPVKIQIRRGDEEKEMTIRLGSRPAGAQLYAPPGGLWSGLTRGQMERARALGQSLADLTAAELADGWTTYSGPARATLMTEYFALVRLAWAAERDGRTLSDDELQREARARRDRLTIEVDLPSSWRAGSADRMTAQWEDRYGIIAAERIGDATGSPPGFQRILIEFTTEMLSRRGSAQLLLRLDGERTRRFLFDLDGLH